MSGSDHKEKLELLASKKKCEEKTFSLLFPSKEINCVYLTPWIADLTLTYRGTNNL